MNTTTILTTIADDTSVFVSVVGSFQSAAIRRHKMTYQPKTKDNSEVCIQCKAVSPEKHSDCFVPCERSLGWEQPNFPIPNKYGNPVCGECHEQTHTLYHACANPCPRLVRWASEKATACVVASARESIVAITSHHADVDNPVE